LIWADKVGIVLSWKSESDWWGWLSSTRLTDSDEVMLKLFKFDREVNMKQWRLLNDWNESIYTFNKIDVFSLPFLPCVLVETLAARLESGESLLNM